VAAAPGARIILSGFLISDEPAIKSALIQNGLVFNAAVQKGEWLAVLAYNKT
jgi:ribosomal protein L11 methylase PrmA